jgi:hypothetical protein
VAVFLIALVIFAVNRSRQPSPLMSAKTPSAPPTAQVVDFNREAAKAKARAEEEERKRKAEEEEKAREPISAEPVELQKAKVGCTYLFEKAVQGTSKLDMPPTGDDPGFSLPAGMPIKILAMKSKDNVLWFSVRATDEDGQTTSGWFDSTQLAGTKLQQVAEVPKAGTKRVESGRRKTEKKDEEKKEEEKKPVHVFEMKD